MKETTEGMSLVGFWKKEMKHNIGLMLIATLALFFQIFSPLYTEIVCFDSISGHQEEIRNVILSATMGDQVMVTLTLEMSMLAVAIGILLMGDFYSRKRRDFYFSLPVSRNKLFWLVYSLGIVSVAVPFLLLASLALAVLSVLGIGSSAMWVVGAQTYLVGMLYYIAVYSLIVLITCISGSKIYAALGSAFLFLFGLVWQMIVSIATSNLTVIDNKLEEIALQLCPAQFFSFMGDSAIRGAGENFKSLDFGIVRILIMIVVAVIAAVLASKAFTKRGEEDNRLPIVFSKPAWVVKGILLFTLLSFHLYATINMAESKDYPIGLSIIGVVLAAIMDIGIGTFLLDRFYDREKEHFGKTLKQQGILAISCIGLFVVSYFIIR